MEIAAKSRAILGYRSYYRHNKCQTQHLLFYYKMNYKINASVDKYNIAQCEKFKNQEKCFFSEIYIQSS